MSILKPPKWILTAAMIVIGTVLAISAVDTADPLGGASLASDSAPAPVSVITEPPAELASVYAKIDATTNCNTLWRMWDIASAKAQQYDAHSREFEVAFASQNALDTRMDTLGC